MSHRIGIALLVVLCSCSTSEPDPVPPAGPASGSSAHVPAPANDSLPKTAQLIPEPVDSVADVPGRYAQPFALPGQVSLITIGTPNYGTGSYELYRSCGVPNCVPEIGQYTIIPTNPAIGFAALTLADQTGTVHVTYVLDYLWRDSDGQLVAIQLRALLGNATGPTQVWWRLPDDASGSGNTATRTIPTEPAASTEHPTTIAAASTIPPVTGVFVRALPIYGDIGAVVLEDETWSGDTATGSYVASYPYCLPWCLSESGGFELDLANPLTGTGQLTLVPLGNPTAAHQYAVYAIWRAPDATPVAIQLQRVDGVTPSGPPFTLYRQWWTPATP